MKKKTKKHTFLTIILIVIMSQPPIMQPFQYMPWHYFQYPICQPIPASFGQYHNQISQANNNYLTPTVQIEPLQSSTPSTININREKNQIETLTTINSDNIEEISEEEESEVEIEVNNTMAKCKLLIK